MTSLVAVKTRKFENIILISQLSIIMMKTALLESAEGREGSQQENVATRGIEHSTVGIPDRHTSDLAIGPGKYKYIGSVSFWYIRIQSDG